MILRLSTFENGIDPKILKRGREYYEAGAVTRIGKDPEGKITATVAGTEKYRIELVLTGEDTVSSFRCSCPYEYGSICKHTVAVIYELRDTAPLLDDEFADLKRETAELEKSLAGLTREELIELIRDKAAHDESWRALILSRFSRSDTQTLSSRYDAILKAAIDNASGRHGYIEYSDADTAADGALTLLDEANMLLARSEYGNVLLIIRSIIVNMYEALMNADDSGGSIGGTITDAIELLSDMAVSDLPEDIRKEALSLSTDPEILALVLDFGWSWDLLRVGTNLVRTDDDERRLLEAADALVGEGQEWGRQYAGEHRALLELELCRKRRTPPDCAAFITAHIRFPQFREMVLEELSRKNDYAGLVAVARDGILQDGDSAPGDARRWTEWILKAAMKENDIPTIRETAEVLFFCRYDMEYYRLLKTTIPPEAWSEERERIFTRLQGNDYVLQALFNEEGLPDRLKESIWKRPSLELLTQYLKALLGAYRDETLDLLEQLIYSYLERQKDRKFYRHIAGILGLLSRSGETVRAKAIARKLVDIYGNRPALRDELSSNGFL